MTLHLYFARRFFRAFLVILGMISGLIFLVEIVESIRRFSASNLDLSQLTLLTLLTLPESLYGILPLIVIIATIAMFIGLSRTSEMVVTRAAGRSAFRSLGAPVAVALLLGVVTLVALNPIVSATARQHEAMVAELLQGEERALSVSAEGLWLRQGNQEGQTVIRAQRANLDGTVLYNVELMGIDSDARPVRRINARQAELIDGYWRLTRAKEWRLSGRGDIPEQDAVFHATLDLPTDLTAEGIRDSFGTPSAIPIWELPEFIEQLDNAGFSALTYRTWFHSQLALPASFVAMVMLGACFTMRHTRMGRTGIMVLISVLMGFGLYFVRNFATILAENGQVPVLIAAWTPPVAAIFLSLGLLLHQEDG
ncbi:MAG: LPS export ABC transporter permease LptG [Pseudomonadota bacterium]